MKSYKNYEPVSFYPEINGKRYTVRCLYNKSKGKLEIVKLITKGKNVIGLLYHNETLLEKLGIIFFNEEKELI